MICLPSYIDRELWAAFLESRIAHKAPFTDRAQKLFVIRLMKAHNEGWDVNAALEDAAINGWKTIYPKAKLAAPGGKDPALMKIEKDAAMAVPMPETMRIQMGLKARYEASKTDPDSRSNVEREAAEIGIGPWDELTEQWAQYKARVRAQLTGQAH